MAAKAGNKNAVGNTGGRPSKYKKEYAKQATNLCLLGATDQDIADFFGVDVDTVNTWKKKHIEFSESLKAGKLMADANVGMKLYQRATGYTHPEIDIKIHAGKVIKTRVTKHYPPDTTAAIFWLKNRRKDIWRDKQTIEIDYDKLTDEQIDLIFERLKSKS